MSYVNKVFLAYAMRLKNAALWSDIPSVSSSLMASSFTKSTASLSSSDDTLSFNSSFAFLTNIKTLHCNLANYLALSGGWAFDLNKLESPSPKDALWQVSLKLVHWFQRRSRKCEKCTDRQMDDGQKAIRIPHLNLQFR